MARNFTVLFVHLNAADGVIGVDWNVADDTDPKTVPVRGRSSFHASKTLAALAVQEAIKNLDAMNVTLGNPKPEALTSLIHERREREADVARLMESLQRLEENVRTLQTDKENLHASIAEAQATHEALDAKIATAKEEHEELRRAHMKT